MGLSIDWSREIATCDPSITGSSRAVPRLPRPGLVYRKEGVVNWDPVDKTVLANEQVIDGRGWRSGAPVEKRKLTQWFLRITDYADELLRGLDTLDRWPDKVRLMQENWIGRSKGLRLRFAFDDAARARLRATSWKSTRPGPTRCSARASWRSRPTIRWPPAAAPDDPSSPPSSPNAARRHLGGGDRDRREERLSTPASRSIHPFDPDWRLPVWVANFVLMEYGTGAIFGCPAHDQRDLDFARKYGLPVDAGRAARRTPIPPPSRSTTDAYVGDGAMFNSALPRRA